MSEEKKRPCKRWTEEEKALLVAEVGARMGELETMKAHYFWRIIGGSFSPPRTHASVRQQYYRIVEERAAEQRKADELAALAPSKATQAGLDLDAPHGPVALPYTPDAPFDLQATLERIVELLGRLCDVLEPGVSKSLAVKP